MYEKEVITKLKTDSNAGLIYGKGQFNSILKRFKHNPVFGLLKIGLLYI